MCPNSPQVSNHPQTAINDNEDACVKETQVSELYRVGVQTLRNWRFLGKGPAYVKFGRAVRYRLGDIKAFMNSSRIFPR